VRGLEYRRAYKEHNNKTEIPFVVFEEQDYQFETA
jgi:hypothetical protein